MISEVILSKSIEITRPISPIYRQIYSHLCSQKLKCSRSLQERIAKEAKDNLEEWRRTAKIDFLQLRGRHLISGMKETGLSDVCVWESSSGNLTRRLSCRYFQDANGRATGSDNAIKRVFEN